MGNLVRLELEKTAQYRLIDRYDLDYLIEKNNLKLAGCYGALCLSGIGKVLNLDLILSGSVELAGDMIITHFRLINVKTEQIERSIIRQYLNIPKEVPEMVSLTIKEFYELPINAEVKRKLTKQNDFDNMVNNPTEYRLASDGPRMGFTVFTGTSANRIQESKVDNDYIRTHLDSILKNIGEGHFYPKPTPLCHWCVFSPTNPNQPESAKNLCPYFCKWTKQDKTNEVENEWQGENMHPVILESFVKKNTEGKEE
jgi:hypothetical protein